MRNVFRCVLLAGLLLGVCASAADEIALNRDTDVRIIEIGRFGNAQFWLRELLERYLLQALKKRDLAGSGAPVTFVVEARAATWQEIPRDEINEITDIDAFEIEILPGKDSVVRVTGATVLAAGFGVMHFLEKHLGIMWLFPGELGVSVPDRPGFVLPAGRERVAPAYVSRLCTGFVYRNKSIPARRFRYEGLLHKHSLFFYGHDYFKSMRLHHLASPSHNMIRIFPLSTRETDPELLPMKDGERWVPPDKDSRRGRVGWWQAWHPCYTNPKAVDIAARKGHAALDAGAYCFSLGINDGHRIQCECPRCREAGWPNSYYQFVSQVAGRLKDYYPPRLVGVLSYGDVTHPPADLRLPENVLIMCASGGPERHVRWRRHAQTLGAYEWAHGQGYWIPNFPLAGMAHNARFYRDHGVKFFRAEMHPMWALDGPKVWLRLRQLWTPDLDLDAGLARYCEAAYGEGGAAVCAFYRHWAARRTDVVENGVTPMHAGEWPNRQWRSAMDQFRTCSATDFEFSRKCLADARAKALTEKQRARLTMLETFVEDGAALFDMFRLKDRMFDPTFTTHVRDHIREACALRQRRRALLTRMRDHPEWFLGTSSTLDENLRPTWEERAAMTFPHEMDVGIVTALTELSGKLDAEAAASLGAPEQWRQYLLPCRAEPVRLHARQTHPWYREATHAPLESAREGKAIRFKTGPTDLRITDHVGLKGRRKVNWLAGFAVKLPFNSLNLYRFDIDARGQAGRLDLKLASGSNNVGRTEAAVTADFGPEPSDYARRIALWLVPVARETLEPLPDPPSDAVGMLNIYMTWQPADDEAPFEGSLRLTRLDYSAAQGQGK